MVASLYMNSPSLQFHTLFRAEPEGGFTAIVPSLPGCISYGRTFTEARKMIADAIVGYVASLTKHGEPIPSDQEVFVGVTKVTKIKRPALSRQAYA